MKKYEAQQILEKHHLVAQKKYGQNFLIDDNILKKIVESANITKDDYVIEIGPGLGSLTDYLSLEAKHVICYEIDKKMVEVLNQKAYPNVTILQQDFLKASLEDDIKTFANNQKVKIVANLPYYITTPILLKILKEPSLIDLILVMVQKEVAARLSGAPFTKDYNALSVLIQYFTIPQILFDVLPQAFLPSPSVNSSVLAMRFRQTKAVEALDADYFYAFNRNIFAKRRKTLLNNIQCAYPFSKEVILGILDKLSISKTVRAEELTVDEIVILANEFYLLTKNH